MQDDEKYKKIKEALDRLHRQKQNSKENLNSQTLSDNKTINNQNTNFKDENLKNINLSNSKNNLKNQPNLQNNTKQNFNNSDKNLNSNKNSNSSNSINQRDYDKNPIIINDYSNFFTGTQRLFALMFGIAFCSTFIGFPEAIIIFPIIVFPSIVSEYYFSIKKSNYTICLKNNKILFLIDNNIERIIDTNEISKYIYMPFWKTNEKSVNIYFFIFILGIFCIFYNYIEFNIFILLVCEAICLFISVDFGNILHKMLVYFCINKTLSGFRIFPILIIEKPIVEKTVEKEIIPTYRYEADFKCYYIYFYNELIYKEIREYFLQNLNIDISKIKKTISII